MESLKSACTTDYRSVQQCSRFERSAFCILLFIFKMNGKYDAFENSNGNHIAQVVQTLNICNRMLMNIIGWYDESIFIVIQRKSRVYNFQMNFLLEIKFAQWIPFWSVWLNKTTTNKPENKWLLCVMCTLSKTIWAIWILNCKLASPWHTKCVFLLKNLVWGYWFPSFSLSLSLSHSLLVPLCFR